MERSPVVFPTQNGTAARRTTIRRNETQNFGERDLTALLAFGVEFDR
ncbi:MAG: hypothetical protein IJO40_15655 [Thermoguttaceae bacterium]|nr:hypothetical protein [Thermoguttaceae bacterium]